MTTNHKHTPNTEADIREDFSSRQAGAINRAIARENFDRMIAAAEQRGADRVLKYFQDHVIEVGEYTYIGATIQELIVQASENRADREGDGGRN